MGTKMQWRTLTSTAWRWLPLAGRVLDEDHLACSDRAAIAVVASRDLHTGVEI